VLNEPSKPQKQYSSLQKGEKMTFLEEVVA